MQTELARLDGNRVELRVEVAPDEVGRAIARAYQQVAAKVRIPGFRPGKAPRPLIDRYVGRQKVIEEAFDALFPRAYLNAIRETGVEPIDQPEVSDIALEEGKPCTFKVQVEVVPEVRLGKYKGLTAVKTVVPVTDADVDQVLAHLQERHSELLASERERLEKGLFAVIDFDGFVDGEPFAGGAGRDVTLEVGGGRFLPEFEEGLVGAARGEEREIKVTFPADHRAEHLAGKEALFKVKVKEIKEKHLPELDDEFAKDVSDFASLAELKADIRRQIAAEREKAAREAIESQLVAAAAANATVEVPEKLIERRVESKLRGMVAQLQAGGYTLADYLGEDRTEEDLRRDLRGPAEEEVKTRLVVEAIAKAEQIRVTEEEVLAKLQSLAGGDAERAAQLRQRLEQEDRLDDLVARLAAERAVNLLVETAEIKEEVTPAEPEKDKEEKGGAGGRKPRRGGETQPAASDRRQPKEDEV
ncbi:MAG: trigger factor [Bacillota bacterium]|nr:trigger factor [Bacillota bacterium]